MSVLHVRFRRHPNDERNGGGHVTVQVFTALAPDDVLDPTVGNAGEVVFRAEEWDAMIAALSANPVEDLGISGISFRLARA